jgi:hypothetical protein
VPITPDFSTLALSYIWEDLTGIDKKAVFRHIAGVAQYLFSAEGCLLAYICKLAQLGF